MLMFTVYSVVSSKYLKYLGPKKSLGLQKALEKVNKTLLDI